MGKQARMAVMLVSALFLWGCQPQSNNTQLMDGKVVSVGKTHLILDDGKSVLFVTIEESDKEHLKDLKKGDDVTLVSKQSADDEKSVEVVEIITADGIHIPLGV